MATICLVFKWHIKTWPFDIGTTFHHSISRLFRSPLITQKLKRQTGSKLHPVTRHLKSGFIWIPGKYLCRFWMLSLIMCFGWPFKRRTEILMALKIKPTEVQQMVYLCVFGPVSKQCHKNLITMDTIFQCHLNTGPFNNQKGFDHSNTGYLLYVCNCTDGGGGGGTNV